MIKNYLNELADFLEIRYPTKKFSNDLGFSQSTVSVYLNDKVKVSENFIEKLNEVYKIDYKKFVKKLKEKENKVKEPEFDYGQVSDYEKTVILKYLEKTKKEAESYFDQLENTQKSAHVFTELIEMIEILKKISREIEKIKNN